MRKMLSKRPISLPSSSTKSTRNDDLLGKSIYCPIATQKICVLLTFNLRLDFLLDLGKSLNFLDLFELRLVEIDVFQISLGPLEPWRNAPDSDEFAKEFGKSWGKGTLDHQGPF